MHLESNVTLDLGISIYIKIKETPQTVLNLHVLLRTPKPRIHVKCSDVRGDSSHTLPGETSEASHLYCNFKPNVYYIDLVRDSDM